MKLLINKEILRKLYDKFPYSVSMKIDNSEYIYNDSLKKIFNLIL